MTEAQTLKPYGHFPIVMCPGCINRMMLKDMRPSPKTDDLYAAKYRCAECGTETNRKFKREFTS
jgi:DNA-directed RNA polymerase subunit RPC12/RpoP